MLRSASLPTLERLIFQTPPETALTSDLSEGTLKLGFDRPMTVDAAALRAALPAGVSLASHDAGKEATNLVLTVPKDWLARSFRDDDGLTVDLLRPGPPPALSLAGLQQDADAAAKPAPVPPAPAAA